MTLPFTTEQFLEVFKQYNQAIWPLQVGAYIVAAVTLLLTFKRTGSSGRLISGVLSCLWLWTGAAYHLAFFSAINRAAVGFGILFILQGLLFAFEGVVRGRLSFRFRADTFGIIGALFVLYAMLIYPVLGYLLGHGYPSSPCFGVAPCPTTIFTFGLLLWADRPPRYLVLLPLIWSIIGFFAAISLGIREDIGLLVAGLAGSGLILLRGRRGRTD